MSNNAWLSSARFFDASRVDNNNCMKSSIVVQYIHVFVYLLLNICIRQVLTTLII